MIACPNCGYQREVDSLECRVCGYKAKLSQALTNHEKLDEPPVELWARELGQREKPTSESLREVRAEHAKRRRARLKRKIRSNVLVSSKKLRYFYLFMLIAGLLLLIYSHASEDQKTRLRIF